MYLRRLCGPLDIYDDVAVADLDVTVNAGGQRIKQTISTSFKLQKG